MTLPYAFTSLFAPFCAWQDATDSRLNIPIKHRSAWIERLSITLLMVFATAIVARMPWWVPVVDALGCGALFSAEFRIQFNLMRKRPWWYMGRRLDLRKKGDSWYDGRWHWLAWMIRGSMSYRYHAPAILANCGEMLVLIAAICIPLMIR
jgi:hypothetical protein